MTMRFMCGETRLYEAVSVWSVTHSFGVPIGARVLAYVALFFRCSLITVLFVRR